MKSHDELFLQKLIEIKYAREQLILVPPTISDTDFETS
jgi:hypothetical protein